MDRNAAVNFNRSAGFTVALRKESVDRNRRVYRKARYHMASLSARRAWIEIDIVKAVENQSSCRSPQGERG